jgi:hypothetical protein
MIAAEQASAGSTVSGAKAGAAAVKGLEGGMLNSNRAAVAFLNNIAGMGPLLQAAFPIFGALAFIGVVETVYSKVSEMIAAVQEAPRKISTAFHELISGAQKDNDELLLTNTRLENATAKLEHKPQNLLKEAILEARLEADKLSASLEEGLGKLKKVLEENKVPWYAQALGHAGTKDAQEAIYGKTGAGGLNQQISAIDEQIRQNPNDASLKQRRMELISFNLANAQIELARHRTMATRVEDAYNIPDLHARRLALDALERERVPLQQGEAVNTWSGIAGYLETQRTRIGAMEEKPKLEDEHKRAEVSAEAQRKAEAEANQRRAFIRRIDSWENQQRKEREGELDRGAELITKESEKAGTSQRTTAEKDANLFLGRYYAKGMEPATGFESMAQYSARTSHEERMAGINAPPGANPAGLAVQQANARLTAINTIRDREIAILDVTRDAAQVAEIKAKADLESAQVRYGAEEKIAELQRKEFDEIKGKTEGLLHTLFTNPKNFGAQLKGTLRDAMLRPIEDKLSTMIAGPIQGLFGKRGISDVQLVNGAVPVVIMGAGGNGSPSSGASAGGSSFSSGLFGRFARAGLSLPLAAAMAMGGTPASGASGISAITSGIVGDQSSYTTTIGGQTVAPSGMSSLSSLLGIGGTGGFSGGYGGPGGGTNSGGRGNPLSGILGNFKNINWGGFTRADAGGLPGADGESGTDLGSTGKITGVNGMAGAALSAGGMMLAQRGLLGKDRGTWMGVGEGALGGAMVGMQMGGPLGAVIGGAAGGLIGIGEKIAGVETPEREAARLIGTIYGLQINANSTTIAQIVAMAKQSYGGTISIAVRSAPVRELLQLYADSTGQKSSLLTAQQVHSASMTQSGGSLYQSATWQNGTPYTYASSLPTLGPSGGTIPTSNPMMNGMTSIHLNPQQTADLITTGATQAIAANPRGVALSAGSGNQQSASRMNAAGLSFDPGAIWA